jgi:urea transporter
MTAIALRDLDGVMPRWSRWVRTRPTLASVDYTLRGVGQVVFMNNPLTGLLILAALWIASPWLGLAATVGVVTATVTAVLLGLDRSALRDGLFGFNGLLSGAGLATFLSPQFSLTVLGYVVLVAAASTVVTVAVTRLLLPTIGLPPLTLPFNVATLAFLLAAYGISSADLATPASAALPGPAADVAPGLRAEPDGPASLDLGAVAGALFRGVGQVFLTDSVPAGILIVAGMALCSRIAAGFALLGSAAGLGTALLVGGDGFDAYQGLWGYNAVLSAIAVGGMFYVLTWRSALLAVAAAVTASLTFVAVGIAFTPLGLPALTLPFCLATFAFLLLAGATARFPPVPATEATYPEEHRRRARHQAYPGDGQSEKVEPRSEGP